MRAKFFGASSLLLAVVAPACGGGSATHSDPATGGQLQGGQAGGTGALAGSTGGLPGSTGGLPGNTGGLPGGTGGGGGPAGAAQGGSGGETSSGGTASGGVGGGTAGAGSMANAMDKPRLFVTSDLGGDPDDDQSMVHLLVAANEIDIEGLVLGLGWLGPVGQQMKPGRMNAVLDAYEEVLPNLKTHGGDGYPSVSFLRSIFKFGQTAPKMGGVGDGKATPGSDLLVQAIEKNDPRPLWINAWGGANTIAQALWTLRAEHSAEEMAAFVKKIRIFDILGQDDAGAWITKTFPDLLYIRATGVYGWAPSDSWTDTNVQNHGPMGAVYQDTKWATEGDSPAFFHVWGKGLNDPDKIQQGGWGGRFKTTKDAGQRVFSAVSGVDESKYDPYYMHANTSEGTGAINKWKTHIHNDFAARMDWTIKPKFSDANHHPKAVANGDKTRRVLEVTAAPGATVPLSAAGSEDPDGNTLSYNWSVYREPSTYAGTASLQNSNAASASVPVPGDAAGTSIHIILTVSDNGSPNLTAYRRVIINVK